MSVKRTARPRLLVAGLGNLLLQDDGVGVHAVRALRGVLPKSVCVAEIGTAVLDAMHLIERATCILAIDALRAGGPPGAVYFCRASDLSSVAQPASLHEATLITALELIPGLQPEVWVLGVEPDVIDYGLELSPAVAAALPRVLQEVEAFCSSRVPHLPQHLPQHSGPHRSVLGVQG
jgi:hydrogenase maturation protease